MLGRAIGPSAALCCVDFAAIGLHVTAGLLWPATMMLIVAIVMTGSLWIMYHLNHNMMPLKSMTDWHLQH